MDTRGFRHGFGRLLRPISLVGWWWDDRLICNGYFINEFGGLVPRRTGWMDYNPDDRLKSGERRLRRGKSRITYQTIEETKENSEEPYYKVEKGEVEKTVTEKDLLIILDDDETQGKVTFNTEKEKTEKVEATFVTEDHVQGDNNDLPDEFEFSKVVEIEKKITYFDDPDVDKYLKEKGLTDKFHCFEKYISDKFGKYVHPEWFCAEKDFDPVIGQENCKEGEYKTTRFVTNSDKELEDMGINPKTFYL